MSIILNRAQADDPNAASELLPLVYELRKLAVTRMTNEAAGHPLQPPLLARNTAQES